MRNPATVYMLKLEYVPKIDFYKNIFEIPPMRKAFFGPTNLHYQREDFCPKLQVNNYEIVVNFFSYQPQLDMIISNCP